MPSPDRFPGVAPPPPPAAADLVRTRLLYLPDEGEIGDQAAPRRAFARLADEGRLAAYEAFSFLVEARRDGTGESIRRLLDLVDRFEPTAILWSHPGSFPVTAGLVEGLRARPDPPVIALQDMDAYGLVRGRPGKGTRALARTADVVYVPGTGRLTRVYRRWGARRARLAVHGADSVRFGAPWTPTRERELDVVMIANRSRGRYPGTALPGSRSRVRLAAELQRRHGDRFGLYGSGWEGFPSALGPVDFDRQTDINRRAWVSASWDHYPRIGSYCSNRVPIALLSGVPHVTNHKPGLDTIYPPGSGLFWVRSVRAVADTVDRILAEPVDERLALGRYAEAFARRHRDQEVLTVRLLEDLVALRSADPAPVA
jgi:hypothetical protein